MKAQKTTSLDELKAAHETLYKEFLPTLTRYQDMAKEALELQIMIAQGTLTEAFPKAKYTESALITTFSARETPAKLAVLLDALAKKKIVPGHIVYDPMNFAFHLYE